jgi:hypothetical protein
MKPPKKGTTGLTVRRTLAYPFKPLQHQASPKANPRKHSEPVPIPARSDYANVNPQD